ncbi:MAG: hypothetical protein ACRDNL_20670 [Spirillospora sp.]
MDAGADTRKLADAFIRFADGQRDGDFRRPARDLARAIESAYNLEPGEARLLALAEARDKARSLRYTFKQNWKRAVKADGLARADLDFVSDASPWIGSERLYEAQDAARGTQRQYLQYGAAGGHVRRIIRAIGRDLPREAREARAQGAFRLSGVSFRLVEWALRLAIEPPPRRRREHWSDLNELADGPHPRRAQLRYAVTVLLRGLAGFANPSLDT